MLRSEYAALDGLALAALIARGEVTAQEVKDAALSAIAAVNPEINAVIECWDDGPISTSGPFAGVPFLVKDIVGAMNWAVDLRPAACRVKTRILCSVSRRRV